MRKILIAAVVIFACAFSAAAQSAAPTEINVRYSVQISNGNAGHCGCFAMQGAAGGLGWNIHRFGPEASRVLGVAADVSVEHTGKVNSAPYGLTLSTLTFGPHLATPAFKSTSLFAQTLFGWAHGSNSQFPVNNSLVRRANGFAILAGGGMDHAIAERISLRLFQVQYLRTSLPNNVNSWQSNLQISAGVKFSLGK